MQVIHYESHSAEACLGSVYSDHSKLLNFQVLMGNSSIVVQ